MKIQDRLVIEYDNLDKGNPWSDNFKHYVYWGPI